MADGTGAETSNTISGGQFSDRVILARDINVGLNALGPVSGAALRPPAQLPPAVVGFAGRDGELDDLLGMLEPVSGTRAALPVAVAGRPGVGKTALVTQAGQLAVQRGWFPGGVLFINLRGYHQAIEPAQALDALLRWLGEGAGDIPLSADERAAHFRSVLAGIGQPVLLIADDAASEAQVRPLLPGTAGHRVMITCRHTLADLDARIFVVKPLDEAAGITLLDEALRAARPADDRIVAEPDSAARLVKMCDGLPIALRCAAAQLKADEGLTVSELTADFDRLGLRLLQYDDGSGSSAPSVEAAFELSYRRLDETSARAFRALPVNPGPDFSTATAAVLTGLPGDEVKRALRRLASAYLVEARPQDRWQLSDLLSLFARRQVEASGGAGSREQERDRLLDYYLRRAQAAVRHLGPQPATATPEAFPDATSALAWLDAEYPNLVAASRMAAVSGRPRVAMRLALLLAGYLSDRRNFGDWLATATIGLDAARQLADRHDVGEALINLGLARRKAGESAGAVTALAEAADTFRGVNGRIGHARALTNLGLALREADKPAEAVPALEQAVQIFRETRNQDYEAAALGILGGALWAAGRAHEAAGPLQAAAEIFRNTNNQRSEGKVWGDYGAMLLETGQPEPAVTAYSRAAGLFRSAGDRQAEGDMQARLGDVLRDTGQPEQASAAYSAAAALFRQTGDQEGEESAQQNLEATSRHSPEPGRAVGAHQPAGRRDHAGAG